MRREATDICGRYVTPEVAEAERNLMVHWLEYERSYNVAPSQRVPVVRWFDGARQGLHMRWGLVPFFARGVPPKYSTINATIERIEDGACWKGPWARGQRCLLPASGFYEWHVLADGNKRPYYVTCADQPVFSMAGLWDRSIAADGTETVSCTVVTLPANELMAEIHNAKQRMPAILAGDQVEAWLSGSVKDARAALAQYPAETMVAHPVSNRVNSPKNDDPRLIDPAPIEPTLVQGSLLSARLVVDVTITLQNADGTPVESIVGTFSGMDLDLFGRFVSAMKRVRESDLLMRGLPSSNLAIRHGRLEFSCAPYTDNELAGLLHVLRPVMLHREATSFNNVKACIGRGFRSKTMAKHLDYLDRSFSNGRASLFMQLQLGGRDIFDESVLDAWLNGTQYHTDADKAADWARVELMLTTQNARSLAMHYVYSRVEALFMLEAIVNRVLDAQ